MKTWELSRFSLDGLALAEKETPKPGPGQVLVRMHAYSLNFRDLLVAKGAYNPRSSLSLCSPLRRRRRGCRDRPGVTTAKTGDRVAACFMQRWSCRCRHGNGGQVRAWRGDSWRRLANTSCWTPRASYPFRLTSLTRKPRRCPAPRSPPGMRLMSEGQLKPGESCSFRAPAACRSSPFSSPALAGAGVIATSSSDEKLARVDELGAADGINYRTTRELGAKRSGELTGNLGCDHVVEVGGAGTLPQSLRRPHGGPHQPDRRPVRRRGHGQPASHPHEEHSRPGHLRRQPRDVRGHEPRHRVAPDAAGHRSSLPVRGASAGRWPTWKAASTSAKLWSKVSHKKAAKPQSDGHCVKKATGIRAGPKAGG